MNASDSDLADTLGPAQADPAELPDRGGKLDRLTGLATHDAEKWGDARTDEDNPRPVVRLADLVRLVRDRTGLPRKRAAAAMSDKIDGGGVCALFVLRPDDRARPVTDADIWRPRFASGAEQWAGSDPHLYDAEAFWRGFPTTDNIYRCVDRDAPELPELRGVAGALEMLRIVWAQRPLNSASLDDGPAAELAMLLVDAVRLFEIEPDSSAANLPTPAKPAAVAAPVAVVRQLAQVGVVNRIPNVAKVDIRATKKPGEEWKGGAEADLLSQFEYLTNPAGEALKAYMADGRLASVWSVSESAIKQARLRAAKRRPIDSVGID